MRSKTELLKLYDAHEEFKLSAEENAILEKAIRERTIKNGSEKIIEEARRENWEEIAHLGQFHFELMPYAFIFYDKFPEELQRRFALGCYMHHGDSLGCCRAAVRKLEKRGLQELPATEASKEEIVIYRAGEEDANKARYRLSWTLSEDKALWFYNHPANRARFLYRAKIKPCDVIAFLDDREEKEVLQYRKLYGLEVLKQKGGDNNKK